MRILIDEDLNVRLWRLFPYDDVSTVEYMGWKGLDNGTLLDTAEHHGFELVITGDTNMGRSAELEQASNQASVDRQRMAPHPWGRTVGESDQRAQAAFV